MRALRVLLSALALALLAAAALVAWLASRLRKPRLAGVALACAGLAMLAAALQQAWLARPW